MRQRLIRYVGFDLPSFMKIALGQSRRFDDIHAMSATGLKGAIPSWRTVDRDPSRSEFVWLGPPPTVLPDPNIHLSSRGKIEMLGDRRSHGLWEATALPAPRASLLEGALTTDFLVVGAGFAGCSAARQLAADGHRVVLLEAVEIGFGAAGRNSGLLNGGMWILPAEILRIMGKPYGERMLGLLMSAPQAVKRIIADEGIACDLIERGTLHLAVGKNGLEEIQERYRQRHARGARVELLGAEETKLVLAAETTPVPCLTRKRVLYNPYPMCAGLQQRRSGRVRSSSQAAQLCMPSATIKLGV